MLTERGKASPETSQINRDPCPVVLAVKQSNFSKEILLSKKWSVDVQNDRCHTKRVKEKWFLRKVFLSYFNTRRKQTWSLNWPTELNAMFHFVPFYKLFRIPSLEEQTNFVMYAVTCTCQLSQIWVVASLQRSVVPVTSYSELQTCAFINNKFSLVSKP